MVSNIGIIGCGSISKFHQEGYRRARAKIIAVSDVNEELARETARIWDAAHYADYQKLLGRDDIQAVSVCVPNFLHHKVTSDALEAGKHVLCEKPMTTILADAEDLAEKVRQTGLIFQVAYMKRFNPAFILMRELLPQIGRIETGHFRVFHPSPLSFWQEKRQDVSWHYKAKETGGCALPHSGSHLLDTLLWFFGEPVSVDARVMRKPGQEVDYLCTAFLELGSGATIFFEVSWQPLTAIGMRHDGWDEKIELNGTKGRLELYSTFWSGEDSPLLRHYVEQERKSVEYLPGQKNQFNDEVSAFVKTVQTGAKPSPDVTDGYRVQKLIDAIYCSGEERKPIYFS